MFTWAIVKKRIRPKVKKTKNTSYLYYKEVARTVILSRLDFFNQDQLFTYNRVAIRDQKRCWGSCSSKGNLNFSYKLFFLPDCLRDYIIIHELCHLRVLNHSAGFWNEVGKYMPDYRDRISMLRLLERTKGTSLIALKKYQTEHTCDCCEQSKTPVEIK